MLSTVRHAAPSAAGEPPRLAGRAHADRGTDRQRHPALGWISRVWGPGISEPADHMVVARHDVSADGERSRSRSSSGERTDPTSGKALPERRRCGAMRTTDPGPSSSADSEAVDGDQLLVGGVGRPARLVVRQPAGATGAADLGADAGHVAAPRQRLHGDGEAVLAGVERGRGEVGRRTLGERQRPLELLEPVLGRRRRRTRPMRRSARRRRPRCGRWTGRRCRSPGRRRRTTLGAATHRGGDDTGDEQRADADEPRPHLPAPAGATVAGTPVAIGEGP